MRDGKRESDRHQVVAPSFPVSHRSLSRLPFLVAEPPAKALSSLVARQETKPKGASSGRSVTES